MNLICHLFGHKYVTLLGGSEGEEMVPVIRQCFRCAVPKPETGDEV